jgi:hypothetical protein
MRSLARSIDSDALHLVEGPEIDPARTAITLAHTLCWLFVISDLLQDLARPTA